MPDRIDYKFISDLEGGSRTTGYVPAAGVSSSGVTIATGFYLGQRNAQDLRNLGLNESLLNKLKQYLGKTRQDAVNYLREHPLTITVAEAAMIDRAVKKSHVEGLVRRYNTSSYNTSRIQFFNLPAEAQTVIASVSFQYGVGLDRRAPKFWRAACAQNWAECVKILKNFGDSYPTRRRKEAVLLERIVK